MGTNYYRIPKAEEMEAKKKLIIQQVTDIDLSPSMIERGFTKQKTDSVEFKSPWDIFLENTSIHLGKRSAGWKFCWNFHKNKFYSNKEELVDFIRSGRVVDEYGEEWDVDNFILMALNWGEPDGLVLNHDYRTKQRLNGHGWFWLESEKHDDLIIDGLRVSTSIDFS